MLSKGEKCRGCPAYGDGLGFVPDEVRVNSPVLVMGQMPGKVEEKIGTPFSGPTGLAMNSRYLPYAGLSRGDVSVGNVLRCRWGHNEDKLPPVSSVVVRQAIDHCERAYFKMPEGVKLIITQGDYALLWATGESSSTNWRGWVLPFKGTAASGAKLHLSSIWVPTPQDLPVLATVHLARLYKPKSEWLYLPTAKDWGKAARVLQRTWPSSCPPFRSAYRPPWPSIPFAFDTEFYTREDFGPTLIRYSIAWESREKGSQICVVEGGAPHYPVPVRGLHVIAQNWWADLANFEALTGVNDAYLHNTLHDLMLAHSVLYSDMPHDLDFLGSIYSSMNRWKHLREREGAAQLYSAADAWGAWECWPSIQAEFEKDPRSREIYSEYVRPMIPVIQKAQAQGRRVWKPRIIEGVESMQYQREDAQLRAQAAAGWPINLASPQQVGAQLYGAEGLPQPRRGKGHAREEA